MPNPFVRTRALEAKLDSYLDSTSEVGLLFPQAIRDYLKDDAGGFEGRRARVNDLENDADRLRIEIERQLYMETLIPESRGDVLGLLEQTDEVITCAKVALMQVSVEQPTIPEGLRQPFAELAEYASRSVQELVMGVRAFFRNPSAVPDHVHKVAFWEKEADDAAETLKRSIFDLDVDLACKIHLAQFVDHIDSVNDSAEDVSERLTISTIKRSI